VGFVMQWSCRVEKSGKFSSLIGYMYFCCKKGRVPVIIDCLGHKNLRMEIL